MSILKSVRSVHEVGNSLNGYIIDDIVMVDDDPKFIGIELQNLNCNTENQHYKSVLERIDRIYDLFNIHAEVSRLKDDLGWR
ncbi:hypothetical protein RHMOL_Rhmol02G0145100 [Rhododendron molle]|uniref:Uncharacterized protein n=1 Tax=Rhododendron molle TaxID=49168 RepID=A0ACC0PRG9_RHOML|nr:hypothetical protein RHMOL_Rhmol02G0145100 [Rhododendron molle]